MAGPGAVECPGEVLGQLWGLQACAVPAVTGCGAADGPGNLTSISCLQKMGYTIQEIPIFIFMGVVGKRVLLFRFD